MKLYRKKNNTYKKYYYPYKGNIVYKKCHGNLHLRICVQTYTLNEKKQGKH